LLPRRKTERIPLPFDVTVDAPGAIGQRAAAVAVENERDAVPEITALSGACKEHAFRALFPRAQAEAEIIEGEVLLEPQRKRAAERQGVVGIDARSEDGARFVEKGRPAAAVEAEEGRLLCADERISARLFRLHFGNGA